MIRNVSNVKNVFKLFGLTIFSYDYTLTEIEESDVVQEVKPVQVQAWDKWKNCRTKRSENIMFLEKLYNQDNNRNNLDDNQI